MVASICLNTKVPWGIHFFGLFNCCLPWTRRSKILTYRIFILILTFFAYACFHMSRKPISVVHTKILHCPTDQNYRHSLHLRNVTLGHSRNNGTCTSWISAMDGESEEKAHYLLGFLDTSYLISYAFFMFFSGFVAERVNLRYFLSIGMFMAGLFTILFGAGKYFGIHSYAYFITIQVFGGMFQTTGWPGVVTVVANWFGKGKKGLIFGVWNSHTSIGNIAGGALAGIFVEDDWGLSFAVPGLIILCYGIVIWLLLVDKPEDVGLNLNFESRGNSSSSSLISIDQYSQPSDMTETSYQQHRARPQWVVSGTEEIAPLLLSETVVSQYPSFRHPPALSSESSISDISENMQLSYENSDANDAHDEPAISFFGALRIPGVVEFSLSLFFSKLVSYTFLYWLPSFIQETALHANAEDAAYLSTLFDVGGIVGGILAGLSSDWTGKPATTCAAMLIAAIPTLFSYDSYGKHCPLDIADKSGDCYIGNVALLVLSGLLVNGPYALITTAVSAELGTHPSLQGSSKALATVTAIIDGTGSIGAAIGPFLAASLQGQSLDSVFYMLMGADMIALFLLTRLVYKECYGFLENRRRHRQRDSMLNNS